MRVAVVGAGPAGARTAEKLVRAGHPVVLFDPSHPREKPCGGGVTPALFRKIPELRDLQLLGRPAGAVRIRSPGGELLRISLPEPIVVLARKVLDGALLERARRAGAVHRPERVKGVRIDGDGAWVQSDGPWERYDVVVGADGPSSRVRRSLLGGRAGRDATWAAGGFFVQGLEEEDLYVEFLPDLKGYLWAFPRPDHASVGIICPAGTVSGKGLRARVLEMLHLRYPQSDLLPRTPYGASIPTPPRHEARRLPLGGEHFALVGDAAAQVDAISGEGIHHALEAGEMLSQALVEAGPVEGPLLYQRRWQRSTGRDLAVAARWAARYYSPPVVEFALNVGRRSRRARHVMADLLMVLQPYSGLRRRLLRELVQPTRDRPVLDEPASSAPR
jgi:flavin-dependent dehydrogenase